MKGLNFLKAGLAACLLGGTALCVDAAPKIYIAFQWHMHQPIYTPGETVLETHASGQLSYDLLDVFTSRYGAYTNWPAQAVNKLIEAGLPGGAQVSFSGSLVENLNVIEASGKSFNNWKQPWLDMIDKKSDLGNSRLEMVGFGYYHPLMALIDEADVERQIARHKECFAQNFPGMTYSKGIFPPENAFEEHIIPALVRQGLEWVMVDNSHFDRTCEGHPWIKNFSLVETNKADVLNANPGDWTQITGLYCPGKISAGWGHRPHWMKYVDPATGQEYKMIAVPTSLVFGNEDGRGGFGALQYEACLSQLESFNTDEKHPILVVLHHDGDNHGGGSASYYGSNFQNFVDWLKANPDRFECTTVNDYLDRFPPEADDIIHVESGSWWGAGADPEFQKWNGDKGTYPGASESYSPDHNSWGIMTAATNYVNTAMDAAPSDAKVKQGSEYLLCGQTSCYWYWDGTEQWDSKPATAANLAVNAVKDVVAGAEDKTGPSIYHPQREPYNPGGTEWGVAQSSDFTVWSYVFDLSGLKSVKLMYRLDKDGVNPLSSNQNETYAGGDEVGEWQSVEMTGKQIESITNPKPLYKAEEYSAMVKGVKDALVDYYIEATDNKGNVSRSQILHVYVGENQGSGPGPDDPDQPGFVLGSYTVNPEKPGKDDVITITAANGREGMILHWGVNGWIKPIEAYLPAGSQYHTDGKAARTPFVKGDDGKYTAKIGPFNNAEQEVTSVSFVTNTGSDWDNNGGQDYKFPVGKTTGIANVELAPLSLYAYSLGGDIIVRLPQRDSAFTVSVYTASGALVGRSVMTGDQPVAGNFPSGMYIVRAESVDGVASVCKVVVK
ncbi:MAG: hypothetical protein J6L73_03630 [Muribaculaceae bacterium]|nr:hypothetical protein [Muribaculaceae bacterium]